MQVLQLNEKSDKPFLVEWDEKKGTPVDGKKYTPAEYEKHFLAKYPTAPSKLLPTIMANLLKHNSSHDRQTREDVLARTRKPGTAEPYTAAEVAAMFGENVNPTLKAGPMPDMDLVNAETPTEDEPPKKKRGRKRAPR